MLITQFEASPAPKRDTGEWNSNHKTVSFQTHFIIAQYLHKRRHCLHAPYDSEANERRTNECK